MTVTWSDFIVRQSCTQNFSISSFQSFNLNHAVIAAVNVHNSSGFKFLLDSCPAALLWSVLVYLAYEFTLILHLKHKSNFDSNWYWVRLIWNLSQNKMQVASFKTVFLFLSVKHRGTPAHIQVRVFVVTTAYDFRWSFSKTTPFQRAE